MVESYKIVMKKTNQNWQGLWLGAMAAGLMLGAPYAANAADYTWTGNAADGVWTNSKNWAPRGVPGAADTVFIGGTAAVAVPDNVTLKNLRLGSEATLLNDGALNVTGWTSSDGLVEGEGELNIPAGAVATLNVNAPALDAVRSLSNGLSSAAKTKKKHGKFGKVNNKGKLNINISASVDAEFDDVNNNGGDLVLSVAGAATDAPVQFNSLTNEKGTVILTNTGSDSRAFEGGTISNADTLIFDGVRTLAKKDFSNQKGAKMSLKNGSVLGCSGKSKTLDNDGVLEVMEGDAEIQMAVTNKGHLHVGKGHLKIAPVDGNTVTQESGTTTIDDGTLEIVSSSKKSDAGSLQIKGGVLDGSGTIDGDVVIDGGAINVGHSPGLIIINGNFTQTANGLMNMQIWGPVAGLQYDQLRVNGNAYLDGTLNIEYGNNYAPNQSSFWHMTYILYITKFASVNIVNPAPGKYYRIVYSGTGIYSQVFPYWVPGALPTAPASSSFTSFNHQPATSDQVVLGS